MSYASKNTMQRAPAANYASAPMRAPSTGYARTGGATAGRPMTPPPMRFARTDNYTAGALLRSKNDMALTSSTPSLSRAGSDTAGRPMRATWSKNDLVLSGTPLTAAQVNANMGWTPARVRSYWDARARECQEMGDEGKCIAQVARHVPVTLGNYDSGDGLGTDPTPADIANIVSVAGRLIAAPDATLRVQGPAIVAALDRHVLAPVMNVAVQRAMPYVIRYMGPPLVVLYLLSGMATYFSFEVLAAHRKELMKNSRRRKRRRSRKN